MDKTESKKKGKEKCRSRNQHAFAGNPRRFPSSPLQQTKRQSEDLVESNKNGGFRERVKKNNAQPPCVCTHTCTGTRTHTSVGLSVLFFT